MCQILSRQARDKAVNQRDKSSCLATLGFWGRSQLREQMRLSLIKTGGRLVVPGKRKGQGKGTDGTWEGRVGSGPRKGGKKGGNPAQGGCSRPQRKRTGPKARRPARRVQTEGGKVVESNQWLRGPGYASPHPSK